MKSMSRRSFVKAGALGAAVVGAGAVGMSMSGCSDSSQSDDSQGSSDTGQNSSDRVVKVGMWGNVLCDASHAAAYETNAADDLGIKVELVPITFDTYGAMLLRDELDALDYSIDVIKDLEQGVPLAIVNGNHTGCLGFVVANDSDIQNIEDLKGKTIGVEQQGSCLQMTMIVELGQHGMSADDVEWVIQDPTASELEIIDGTLDCFGTWDPQITQVVQDGNARSLLRNSEVGPFKDYVCCYTTVNTNTIENEPELVKKIDQWITAGIHYCRDHPAETAKLLVEGGYVEETEEFCEDLLRSYTWWGDDPEDAGESYMFYLEEFEKQGQLDASTDIDELYEATFVNPNNL